MESEYEIQEMVVETASDSRLEPARCLFGYAWFIPTNLAASSLLKQSSWFTVPPPGRDSCAEIALRLFQPADSRPVQFQQVTRCISKGGGIIFPFNHLHPSLRHAPNHPALPPSYKEGVYSVSGLQTHLIFPTSEMQTPPGIGPEADRELDLLGEDPSVSEGSSANHARRTAPAFTGEALDIIGSSVLPQRALYGRLISQHASHLPPVPGSPKIYINSNTPFSAVVCGVQVR